MQIVEILTDALTLSETPIPTKVARLFLTSDILHNSTAPVRNASRYRTHMEASLPDIFESLQVCLPGLPLMAWSVSCPLHPALSAMASYVHTPAPAWLYTQLRSSAGVHMLDEYSQSRLSQSLR